VVILCINRLLGQCIALRHAPVCRRRPPGYPPPAVSRRALCQSAHHSYHASLHQTSLPRAIRIFAVSVSLAPAVPLPRLHVHKAEKVRCVQFHRKIQNGSGNPTPSDCRNRILATFAPPIAQSDGTSFCRSSDLRICGFLHTNHTLPSRFPSDWLSPTSIVLCVYSGGCRSGFAPDSLVHPRGLYIHTAKPQKENIQLSKIA
jgi:hypothetical protein